MSTNSSSILPEYLAYLSLGFKVIMTMMIFLMAGWVIVTIKTTRRLHKPHNIFVANLMITDMILALVNCVMSGIMTVGHIIETGDFITCNVYKFLVHPVLVIHFIFLMISVDKVMAIKFPLKYRKIMTVYVVTIIIAAVWIFSALISLHNLFSNGDSNKVEKFGTCKIGSAFIETILTYALPIFTESVVTISLNIFLAFKAYQVQKQIQKENRLSGFDTQVEALRQKESKISRHKKPLVTLLVIVLGSSFISLLFLIMYISSKFYVNSLVYNDIIDYIINPNIPYIIFLPHPFAYGLYFKQIRKPMMKFLKSMVRV